MPRDRERLHQGDDVPIRSRLGSLAGRTIQHVTYLAGPDALNLISAGWEIHETQEVELDLDDGSRLNITWALVGFVEGILVRDECTYDPSVSVDVSATHLWRSVLGSPVASVDVHTHLTGEGGSVVAVIGATLHWTDGVKRTISLGEMLPGSGEVASYIPDAIAVTTGDAPPDYQPARRDL